MYYEALINSNSDGLTLIGYFWLDNSMRRALTPTRSENKQLQATTRQTQVTGRVEDNNS